MTEEAITEMESRIPAAAGAAFAAARRVTLAAGLSVLESEDGVIFEVSPDGRRVERKRIEPPTSIAKGTKVRIPWPQTGVSSSSET